MAARGRHVDHRTIYRWVQRYAPQFAQRVRAQLKPTTDSWRGAATDSKVRRYWTDLYRAVDADGSTLEFVLRPTRDAQATESFFRPAQGGARMVMPRVINGAKNAADPPAIAALQAEGILAPACQSRPVKYLKNLIEQDHRFTKRRVQPGLGFGSFHTARTTLRGYEAMNQVRKGPVRGTTHGDLVRQHRFIDAACGVAA